MNFSTAVTPYQNEFVVAKQGGTDQGRQKWVDALQTDGGTAIDKALGTALEMRPQEKGRPFTVIFFTDGLRPWAKKNPDLIVKNVEKRNSANRASSPSVWAMMSTPPCSTSWPTARAGEYVRSTG